ncbi:hypothetical protein Arad_12036 (plasmid) [Rhizobium rhizogenes K84]|uniref:Uncharacterized protein n=1 Tax=Rhizobium rhizogenes (strain K84 / ATCC BAA-868) TaxID=311403 RepID=B9JPP8_RHIR8|nr:hypothetical protein Arad_12036 [Rhizobium rhizogenes K84]
MVKARLPTARHAFAHHGGGKRKLMSKVLNPMHEIGDGCPGVPIMGGNDRIDRIDFRFFYYCCGFDTHWTHVSIPPDGAALLVKLFENSGRCAARVCS